MDCVKQLYELIQKDRTKNTFINHQELFQEFYYHYMSIRYYGVEVLDIYRYLLSLHISEDHETMPYINSNIIEDFNRYISYMTQSVYRKDVTVSDQDVNHFFHVIQTYYEFQPYEKLSALNRLEDEMHFIRDYTCAMMVMLNSSFFQLSLDHIKQLMNSVMNSAYLKQMIEKGYQNPEWMDQDYIYQYTSRFLLNADFMNEKNVENDFLLQALKEGKIKNKKILKEIVSHTNMDLFVSFFHDQLSGFVDALEKTFPDPFDRMELFSILKQKSENKTLFQFLVQDKRSEAYFTEEEQEEIRNKVIVQYDIPFTDQEVNDLLDHSSHPILIMNLKENLKENTWNEETRKRVAEAPLPFSLEEFTYEQALSILDQILHGRKENINELTVFSLLKTMTKKFLNDEQVTIYLVSQTRYYGCQMGRSIRFHLDYVKKLLNTSSYEQDPEALHILNTMFHEARHIQQEIEYQQEEINDSIYLRYKDDILRSRIYPYYNKNYFGISFEQDARIAGAKALEQFLSTYFPDMKQCITYYHTLSQKEEENRIQERRVFELSQPCTTEEAIDKLVAFDPSLLETYPALQKEYYLDGTKKEMEKRNNF